MQFTKLFNYDSGDESFYEIIFGGTFSFSNELKVT